MEINRAISLEDDFMNWHINDLFYTWLLTRADYKKETNTLFMDYDYYLGEMEAAKAAADCSSERTLYRALQELKDSELVEIGKVKWYGKERKALIFKNSFKGKYQIVKNSMLEYVLKTRNKGCVQIYVYLLNKYIMSQKMKYDYDFTYKELAKLLGYKNEKEGAKDTKIMVESLCREGILTIANVWVMALDSSISTTCMKRVISVAQSPSELRPPISKTIVNHKNPVS